MSFQGTFGVIGQGHPGQMQTAPYWGGAESVETTLVPNPQQQAQSQSWWDWMTGLPEAIYQEGQSELHNVQNVPLDAEEQARQNWARFKTGLFWTLAIGGGIVLIGTAGNVYAARRRSNPKSGIRVRYKGKRGSIDAGITLGDYMAFGAFLLGTGVTVMAPPGFGQRVWSIPLMGASMAYYGMNYSPGFRKAVGASPQPKYAPPAKCGFVRRITGTCKTNPRRNPSRRRRTVRRRR